MSAVSAAALAVAGIAVLAATGLSVLWTLVVPRATPSRLAEGVVGAVRAVFVLACRPFRDYRTRDRILAMLPPFAMLTLLVVWLTALAIGFALLAVAVSGDTTGQAFADAAAAVLGAGYVDATPALRAASLAAVLAGVIVIALLIGYLPTLYGAFNQREQLVNLLDSRAGSPAWGVEILARAARDRTLDDLGELFSHWEQWAADVGESHSSYPILIAFRSQEHDRSWLTSLLAVLDAAALDQALRPGAAPLSGRLLLRTGYMALRSVADTSGVAVDHDPHPDDPIQLSRAQFGEAVQRLRTVGYPVERDAEAAWPHFAGWRVNYELAAYALAERIVAPPAPWSGSEAGVRGEVQLPHRPEDRKPGEGTADSPYATGQ